MTHKCTISRAHVKPFEKASWSLALVDMGVSVIAYVLLVLALYGLQSVPMGFWAYILLLPLASLLLIKIFTIQHDCGHRSYTRSPKANRWLGRLCSLLTLVPFTAWHVGHATHHATFGQTEEQEGDVMLLSVEEYKALTPWKRWAYRNYRKPLLFILLGPIVWLGVMMRVTSRTASWASNRSVLLTNAVLLVIYGVLFWVMGVVQALFIFAPIWYLTAAIGIILFRLQHQFEGAVWEDAASWDFEKACSETCSVFKMPPWIHWFFGYIGFHHLHHYSVKIPSYRLPEAYKALKGMLPAKSLSLRDVWWGLNLGLWCPRQKALVSFESREKLPLF